MGRPQEMTAGLAQPWTQSNQACFADVNHQIAIDALAVGVLHTRQPATDELLVVHGLDVAALREWFDRGFRQDPLFAAARRQGVAVCGPDSPPQDRSPVCSAAYVMMVTA